MPVESSPIEPDNPYARREAILFRKKRKKRINYAESNEQALIVSSIRMLQSTGMMRILGRVTQIRNPKTGDSEEVVEPGILTELREEFPDLKETVVRDPLSGLAGYQYTWDEGRNLVQILAAPHIGQGIIEVRGEKQIPPFDRPISTTLKGTTKPFYKAIQMAFENPQKVH